MLGTKRARRRTVRYSLIVGNFALIIGVGALIANAATISGEQRDYTAVSSFTGASSEPVVGPIDQVSSADIAVAVAETVQLTESVAVANQSDSIKTMNAITPAESAVVAKPQVVATGGASNEIIKYVVQAGDTVPSVAAKFNITSDSVRWSNELRGDALTPGTELVIPPVTGLVYTVLIGDTPDSIAQKFRANKDRIIAFNDAEVAGLVVGQRIIVPDGQRAAPAGVGAGIVAGVSGGGAFSARYGYNGYDPGWCTWYVASRISVPVGWGNASTWDDRSRVMGWTVSQVPRIGSIAQKNGGWGHVGYVEDVRQAADGSWEIKYSDMNGLAGFNRVGYSGWVSSGKFHNYIYR